MTDLDIWKLRNEATLSAFVASWGLFRGSSSRHTRTVLTYCWTRSKTTFITASDPQIRVGRGAFPTGHAHAHSRPGAPSPAILVRSASLAAARTDPNLSHVPSQNLVALPCPQSHAVGRQCLHLLSLYPSPQPGSQTVNAGPVATFTCPAVPDCASVGDAEISIIESGGAQYLQRASSLPLCMQPGSQGMKGAATPDVGLIAPAVAVMRLTTRCIEMPRKAVAILPERGRCGCRAHRVFGFVTPLETKEASRPSCMDHGVAARSSVR
jgi:hypothetical protein